MVLLPACSYGGGAILGIGQRGPLAGVEVLGGVTILEAAGGYDTSDTFYARVDAVPGGDNLDGRTSSLGRLGLGVALENSREDARRFGATAVFGGGVYRALVDARPGCGDPASVLSATLEIRYASQWELVLVPRFECVNVRCSAGE